MQKGNHELGIVVLIVAILLVAIGIVLMLTVDALAWFAPISSTFT